MDSNVDTPHWQQFYPTHSFRDRDILLKEYESASNNVLSQERIFQSAANILLVVVTILGSVAAAYTQIQPTFEKAISNESMSIALLLIISFVWLTVRYFAQRQKSITFDSRKLVVLRSMLGLDYGTQQLVLPNWRLEGASNPFAIRMFPGWRTTTVYPFWILALLSATILYYLLPPLLTGANQYLYNELGIRISDTTFSPKIAAVIFVLVWLTALAATYRSSLFDNNETWLLILSRFIGTLLGVTLVPSFEYVLYRARLAKFEVIRQHVDYSRLLKFLIRFEDRTFFENPGVSLRGILRAVKDRIRRNKVSGGSTLTQQLVRSLFIIDYHKTYRRKIVEIVMALWANRMIPKDELLQIYVASVRYDRAVIGILAAMNHFLGDFVNHSLSAAESFFLAERISNSRSRLLLPRIKALVDDCTSAHLLDQSDIIELKSIYRQQVTANRIYVTDEPAFASWLSEAPAA